MIALNKNILDPESLPLVSIDFMNNTHIEELEMINHIGEKVSSLQAKGNTTNEDISIVSELLDNWLEHTQAHFARENELMQEYQFPAYAIHSGEHEAALQTIETVINAWKDNTDIEPLAEYLFSTWPNWFTNHVSSMDKVTAQFAVMNGFT